ncbi:telomerase-binding protein EST1A protein [Phlyctema vagabunda]|uniref:Nonsense-mediated mRNA decay factor n=1 Tax=Phlyctema vagabunda TaxID=108571 RepID=A0ABR4P6H5_9HELO
MKVSQFVQRTKPTVNAVAGNCSPLAIPVSRLLILLARLRTDDDANTSTQAMQQQQQQQSQQQKTKQQDFNDRWVSHQRRANKKTSTWACIHCTDRKAFSSEPDLFNHAKTDHANLLPPEPDALQSWRHLFAADSSAKRLPTKDDTSRPRKPSLNEATRAQPEPPPGGSSHAKRPLSHPVPQTRSISGLQALDIAGSPRDSEDAMVDEATAVEQKPRKRAALGDGISAGSASPSLRAHDSRGESRSPPPRRSKARPTSAPYGSISDMDNRQQKDSPNRPHVASRKLWNPDQDSPMPKGTFDPANLASPPAQKSRTSAPPKNLRKFGQGQHTSPRSAPSSQTNTPSAILGSKTAETPSQTPAVALRGEYDIILEPETRPISQEQLVAEVKGIYAGLVMVEAKCIEVDNKQANSTHTEGAQARLNNEQWQALIALHRTLLHEHHDFFLASQHPSASPALRRLASKYAMPARMWRHGIHSFLELLRHRLPASLDHMLAFIYLAYSMMALLYETVPAFEDTWIECLGDLGRYRMAIEDDDIKDREVWTGVARHWYSKASDKAPTTGRLYHHLAILARPNALQQLFYYSKSLCVVVPFTSARESILTIFEPVMSADNTQYRLPPLDTAFVKAHGLLFTGRDEDRFEPAVAEFLGLLDTQIGRVTRKFMDQGCHIAVSNIVSMLGFASKDNVLIKAMTATSAEPSDVLMEGTPEAATPATSDSLVFEKAERLHNSTLEIVLQRIGDPNVLPFVHIILVFMLNMSRHEAVMEKLEAKFPWALLKTMLNTLLASFEVPTRIKGDAFPLPEKDEVRPFPEDFAIRGLLWTDNYFPADWFNSKIDEEEKYHERPSMTAQRKERILWLAYKLAAAPGNRLQYHDNNPPRFSIAQDEQTVCEPLNPESRSLTFASATSHSDTDRAETWVSDTAQAESHIEDDVQSSTMSPENLS